jgi:hypothetical protein
VSVSAVSISPAVSASKPAPPSNPTGY